MHRRKKSFRLRAAVYWGIVGLAGIPFLATSGLYLIFLLPPKY
jgi:hypothetical protein